MKPILHQGSFSEKHTKQLCDAIITDPPYNISRKINCLEWEGNTVHSMKFDKDDDWDSKSHEVYIDLLNKWSFLFGAVLRPGGQFFSFCADRYISHYWEAMEANGINIKRVFTWCKPNAVPFNRKVTFLSSCEFAIWGYKPGKNKTFNHKKLFDYKDKNQNNYIIRPMDPRNRLHPNQKPLDIMKYLVELLTKPGDIVLDPFMGSGTTGVACAETDRNFIGVEKDPKYFEIAKTRLNGATPKLTLI
jgi:site-specific DNA-methyltransferase (adenine-specific)